MYHFFIADMEAQARRADARRESERLNRIRLAKANGTYESSGWLTSLARRVSRLSSRVDRQKQRISVSPASATPC